MNSEGKPNELEIAILPQKVWETLDASQQKAVLQAVVNLCQQIIEMGMKGEQNELTTD